MTDMTIEQSLKRLEEIVQQLGDSGIALDASLVLYTEGVQLSQQCLQQIDAAQLVVEQHTVEENIS